MSENEIITIVTGYITDAMAGMSKENPKLDFKSKWYDFKADTDINEFLKDSSSIANSPGLDGFIVIGFDDKRNTFIDSVFADSNLKDSNELSGMLTRRVDRIYDITCYDVVIDGHKLSVLHIPPSFDKPHVIKKYVGKGGKEEEHRVFIRHGTTTRIANKYDLDFIAYDRKNHIPEYGLFVSMSKNSAYVTRATANGVDLGAGLIIENVGLRPVAIFEITLTLFYDIRIVSFVSTINKEEKHNNLIKVSNLIVQPASIKNCPALMFSKQNGGMTDTEFAEYQSTYHQFHSAGIKIKLNNERLIETTIQLIV